MALPPASADDYHEVLIKSGYEDRVLLKAQQMDNPAWQLGEPLTIRGKPFFFDSLQKRGAAPNHVGERVLRFASNSETETPPRRRQILGRVWDDHIPFDPNFDTWEQIKDQLVDEANRMSSMAAFARQMDFQVASNLEALVTEVDFDAVGGSSTLAFGETVDGTVDAALSVEHDSDPNTGLSVSKIIAMNAAIDAYSASANRSILMHSIQYNQLFEEARATSTDFMMQATLPSGRIPSIMGHPLVVSNEIIGGATIGSSLLPGHPAFLITDRGFRAGEAGTVRVDLHEDKDRGGMIILSHYWVFEAVRAHEEEVARAFCEDVAVIT